MLNDILIWINTTLFWLLDGQILINTIWFIPWIFLTVFLMFAVFYYVAKRLHHRVPKSVSWALAPISIIIAILIVFIGISPGPIQMQMTQNCKTTQVSIFEEGYKEFDLDGDKYSATVCQNKKNYYEDFSDWKVTKIDVK